ncbi:hypothetical protein KGQ64_09435 [bacterium]|nr:hypothetical protein [bacterium]
MNPAPRAPRKRSAPTFARRLAAACIGSLLSWSAGPALATPSATPAPPREISVTGELVETGCFFVGGRRGPHHRACAMGCARVGQPVAIVDDSGVLRIAILDHRNEAPENPLIEHLGRRVELSGTAVERGGVHGILVRNVRPLSPPRGRE